MFGSKGSVTELKDVIVNNVYYKGDSYYMAALAIHVTDMSNCKITGSISTDAANDIREFAGLACEASGKVLNCIYDAKLQCDTSAYIAGIVYSAIDVENCSTTQDSYIKVNADYLDYTWWVLPASGVAGIVYSINAKSNEKGILKGNVNNALLDATLNRSFNAAGIAMGVGVKYGETGSCEVTDNINNGTIKGDYVSGIADVGSGTTISGCKNTGELIGEIGAAGISSSANNRHMTISDCRNEGSIRSNITGLSGIKDGFGGAAGLFGECDAERVTGCVNTGSVSSAVAASGIIGVMSPTSIVKVDNCHNTGDVSGSEAAGLILASKPSIYDSNGKEEGPGSLVIKRSYNLGLITQTNTTEETFAGTAGLVGYADNLNMTDCYNAGMVDASRSTSMPNNCGATAGLVGRMRNATIKSSYNVGEIKKGSIPAYEIAARDTTDAGTCRILSTYYLENNIANSAAGDIAGEAVAGLSVNKLSSTAMADMFSYSGWDFDVVWTMDETGSYSYPQLTGKAPANDDNTDPDDVETVETITGGMYVVNQKIDTTDEVIFGKTYAKYAVTPKGAASVSKGIATVKRVPSDGKITITGLEKNNKGKYVEAKAYTFTAQKPKLPKTVTFTMPYDAELYTGEQAAVLTSSLVADTEAVPSAWTFARTKTPIAGYDAEKGIIYAISKGSVKVTAVFGDPDSALSAKYSFTVKVNIPKISKTAASLQSNAALLLKLNGVSKTSKVTWSSNYPEYVSVEENSGKITALKYNEDTEGKVIIQAAMDGVKFPVYACEVSVVKPTLSKSAVELKAGKSLKISVKGTRFKAKKGGTDITFKSSDEAIATVDETGKVKGIAAGECTITVNVAGVELPCKVTVK